MHIFTTLPAAALFAALFSGAALGASIDLNRALELTRSSSYDGDIYRYQQARIQAESSQTEAAYDWTLSADAKYVDDRSESQNTLMGERRTITTGEVSIGKMFSTGTRAALKVGSETTDIIFPSSTSTANNNLRSPNFGQGVGLQSAPSASQSFYPEHKGRVALEVVQPLLNGLGSKEVGLQNELVRLQGNQAKFDYAASIQSSQGTTEQIFWNLAALRAQRRNQVRLVALAKRFLRLMKKRQRIGRADEVDIASSEATIVTQEGYLLNLEIAEGSLARRLDYQIGRNATKADSARFVTPGLNDAPLPLPADSAHASANLAAQRRYDLKKLRSSGLPAKKKAEIAAEKDRPSLDVFVSVQGNGLEPKYANAMADSGKGSDPTLALGLSFNMKLGGTALHSARSVATQIEYELEMQIQKILRDVRREIDIAWLELQTGRRLLAQAEAHKSSLKRQRRAEQKKFRQARAGEIGVVRYDMEILSADNERIKALERMRLAEAKIRQLTHSYPGVAIP